MTPNGKLSGITMYTCINCGAETKELYRQYSPSVLKVLKCEKCKSIADKYIEYDPVIVLVDLVLLEKAAYRHLLYNSSFKSYWKLMIVLLMGESFRVWCSFDSALALSGASQDGNRNDDAFERERSFYVLLARTALALGAFIGIVIAVTELRWLIFRGKPKKYKARDLGRALIVGGFAKLLGLLSIIWEHSTSDANYILIHGYTVLCLLTAYSVVCNSGRVGSLIGLIGGLLVHNYFSNNVIGSPLAIFNVTLVHGPS